MDRGVRCRVFRYLDQPRTNIIWESHLINITKSSAGYSNEFILTEVFFCEIGRNGLDYFVMLFICSIENYGYKIHLNILTTFD